MRSYIDRVEAALEDLRQGKMVILTDSPDRENEGDIIFPAENTSPEFINFMIRHCTGIICLSLTAAHLEKLRVPLMVPRQENKSRRGTPFTVSIEAREGISTGVSAADRATTILAAVKEGATHEDIVTPGHIFPLQAREGGVLERQGHTEGAIDLMRLAGFKPAAVLCEVMNPDGTMARGKQLESFAAQHQLKILSIDDIIAYRLSKENLIEQEAHASLPIKKYGMFNVTAIKEKITGHEHLVLTKKIKESNAPLLVRIHSSCITGDLLGSERCDCNEQFNYSLKQIAEEGGMLIYLNQEGRGIGLLNKIKAYALQEQGLDTIEANQKLGLPIDAREFYIAAHILKSQNVNHVRLLTNNPAKIVGLKKYGIETVEQQIMPVFCNEHNQQYLHTKKEKLNHTINANELLCALKAVG